MGEQQKPKDFEEQIVTLERVLQTLREEENVDVLLETTLTYLRMAFDYRLIWIGLYDRLDHRLIGKGGIVPSGDLGFLKQRVNLNPGDLLEQVVIQLRPVGVPDLREETRAGEWRKAAQVYDIQGTIVFPLRYKDRCYGVVLLGSDVWGESPRSGDKALMGLIFGELASALYQIELNWQRQQTKRVDVPLLALLSDLGHLRTLDLCLETVVEETHRFIAPTRTNIYWFERERRYFWRRVGNRQMTPGLGRIERGASGITVQDLGEFYQALGNEQIVWIGESHSSLKSKITGRLMQQIKVRSLLAAPIVLDHELLGFLAVEASEPRIWLEDEKNYLRAVSRLIALTMPLFEMEAKIQEKEDQQALTAQIARGIYGDSDWQNTLSQTAERLCERLKSEYFLLLVYDVELGQFECVYQRHPSTKRKVTTPLKLLDLKDLQLLEKMEAVVIENWDAESCFLPWRDAFTDVGARSLLVCSTGMRKDTGTTTIQNETDNPFHASSLVLSDAPEGLLIIGHETSRTWKAGEKELVEVVSQQLGLILHQWQLNQEISKGKKIYRSLQSAAEILSEVNELPQLEREFTHLMAHSLGVPLVVLVTWKPGHSKGRIASVSIQNPVFALNTNVTIPIKTDPLIQTVLAMPGVLRERVNKLSEATRRWLWVPGIGQILAATLRTSHDHTPMGIVIVGDEKDRFWDARSLDLLHLLVTQLAWSRRHWLVKTSLQTQKEELEWLNWYKQRRLEELYRTVGSGVKQLGELSLSGNNSGSEQKDTLTVLRYQQLLRQIGNALASTNLLLKQEQWRLHTSQELIGLNNLLRRSQERADAIVKKSQVNLEIHREDFPAASNGQVLSLKGDSLKLELVIYELLGIACRRSQPGDHIALHCQLLDEQTIELTITDNGTIEPELIKDLQMGRKSDLLAYSTLEEPPGQHLMICQSLIHQMGGKMEIKQTDEGTIITSLELPIATD